jgi:PadR family transcriptional regulator
VLTGSAQRWGRKTVRRYSGLFLEGILAFASWNQLAPFFAAPAYHQLSIGLTPRYLSAYYLFMADINARALDRELKRGSAELLILSLLDARPRHGYDLSKLVETRSGGQLKFHLDSLYPLLYRLEERGWIKGTWVEKPDERRRRYYKVTPEGRRVLAQQRKTWAAFVEAVRRVTGDEHA